MDSLKILIFICGFYSFALAILQLVYWKVFDLNNNMGNLSFTKRASIQIENTWIIYLLLIVSVTCFLYPNILFATSIGKILLAGISSFWLGKTLRQFFLLRTRSSLINLFSIVFIIGAILFALPLIMTAYTQ